MAFSRIGYMKGGKSALWKDDQIADELTNKAVSFIENHKDEPFFSLFCHAGCTCSLVYLMNALPGNRVWGREEMSCCSSIGCG